MNDDQLLRYSRHILLDEIGVEGQQRLRDAHVLILGAGGLGSPAALYLAASGVGRLTLVDDDAVDLTNLQRQILHSTERIGRNKAQSGRETLKSLNPDCEVEAVTRRADDATLAALLDGVSVALDCSDNFATRQAANRACVARKVPLVSGALDRFAGQLGVFDVRAPLSPCYACLFPPDEPVRDLACSTMGVFAPLAGIVGAMQAGEAIKLIVGMASPLTGRLLMIDARGMDSSTIAIGRNRHCPVCGTP
jgi:molybdopterin/thiamine biosynthesis adenylyltransferase